MKQQKRWARRGNNWRRKIDEDASTSARVEKHRVQDKPIRTSLGDVLRQAQEKKADDEGQKKPYQGDTP